MRLICLIFVCIFSILCWAGDKVQPSTLVQHASEVSDIRGPGAPAFRLKAKVRNYGEQPDEGIYELTWVSSDQWREEISVGNEKTIRIGGRGTVSLENDTAKARSIRGHMRMLNLPVSLMLQPQQSLGPIKDRKKNGVVILRCTLRKGKNLVETELCFDPQQGNLVSESYIGPGPTGSTVVYERYTEFAGKVFPAIVKTYFSNAITEEVEVISLNRLSSADATAFDIGAGYTTMSGCEVPSAPLAIEAPDPYYPNALKTRAPQLVKLSVVVDESGTPQKIKVAQSAVALDQHAIDAVSRWRFSPAMCGTRPVPFPVNIEVTFKTY